MKKIYLVLVVLAFIVLIFGIYKFNFTNTDVYNENGTQVNLHDGVYTVAGQKVILKNGISEVESAPGSVSKIITRYFGNDVVGDFDGDGKQDIAFLITQDTGGSGIFYYVVALLDKVGGKIGTDAVLLGDRIAPQTTELKDKNILVVNYADRKSGESFTTSPSVGKSLFLKLDPKTLQWGEVVQNFEGEADINKMNLNMKTWNWINTIYRDGKIIKPIKENIFSITFKKDNTFSVTTDCNSAGGEYLLNGNKIIFNNMMSTMMYCDGSQEGDFIKMLNETQSYMFTSKGELIFNLKPDTGSIVFK
ncbi:MAG: META domain-containing protein [Candidatus Nomurabacteria bacterium]|nr:META domain-containing protein [Candidatus Nomurabacteria bacterium]